MAEPALYLAAFSGCLVGFGLGMATIVYIGIRIRENTKKSNANSIFTADREVDDAKN